MDCFLSLKIGPQCVLGVLCVILFLLVGMLFSNISIWELTCYKWKGRQVITIFKDRAENIWQNLRCWKYDWMWSSMFDTIFFSGLCSSSVTAALALMTVITQLLLWTKFISLFTILGPSITSTYKGLTRIQPLSCGFDSPVGRALLRHRRGCGFESHGHSESEFFSGLCSSSVAATLALMTVST